MSLLASSSTLPAWFYIAKIGAIIFRDMTESRSQPHLNSAPTRRKQITTRSQPASVGTVPVRIATGTKPQLSFRGIGVTRLVLVEIKYGLSELRQTTALPTWHNAYTVGVRLREESSEVSVRGRAFSTYAAAGESRLVYLPDVDYVDFNTPRHSLEILLTRQFLADLAEDLEASEITRIGAGPYEMVGDPVLHRMARAVLPYMDAPGALDPLFADHFMWSFGAYVGSKYGDLKGRRAVVGGLSSVQERLAKEMIHVNLQSRISLSEVAAACGLRISQFAQAFKHSVGIAPYAWAIQERVSCAKRLIKKGGLSLAEVAHESGFADQSHLTRTFTRTVGTTPAAWQLAQN